MNTQAEVLPVKLLKITERVYGRTFYTSQGDIERANQLGLALVRCRCRNGRLMSHYHAEMGWNGKPGTMVHRSYLAEALIEEVPVLQTVERREGGAI